MNWKTQNNVKTLLVWGLIVFAGWSGYRLYNEGAFRGVKPAIGKVYGKFPIVGKSIRTWAFKKSYRRSYRKGKRYRRGRKAVSRRRRGRRRR